MAAVAIWRAALPQRQESPDPVGGCTCRRVLAFWGVQDPRTRGASLFRPGSSFQLLELPQTNRIPFGCNELVSLRISKPCGPGGIVALTGRPIPAYSDHAAAC